MRTEDITLKLLLELGHNVFSHLFSEFLLVFLHEDWWEETPILAQEILKQRIDKA